MTTTAQPNPRPRPAGGHQRRHARRWLPWLGAVLLVGLIVAGLWPKPVPVETATVGAGNLQSTVNEEGKTRIKQRFVVSAPVSGQLRRAPFKAGATVEAGKTVLAVIDPVAPSLLDARTRSQAEAKRDAAAANLQKAQAAFDFAASELRRFDRLFADKTVSPQEFEAAQLREAAAAREREAASGALRQAEADLAQFPAPGTASDAASAPREIVAPVSGRVLRLFEENVRVVAAGTPLMEIGDPGNLEVVVEVLSRDGAAIMPGAKVLLEQWGGSTPLEGRVRLVEPAAFTKISALGVEEQRVNVIADLLTPPDQRSTLGDNFRVEARIVVWESADTLKVPVGALFRQGDRWAAFVVAAGRAELRLVNTGRSSATETQVVQGLKAGDQIILYPGSRVRDGERVTPIKL